MSKKFIFFAIAILFVMAFFVRSYNLNAPPFEQHQFRQSQTMSTILDYSRNGIDLFHSKVNWVGYPGILVLEFPLFQAISSLIYKDIGLGIASVRLFNIFLSLFGGMFLFLIAKNWFGAKIALYSLFFYLFFPINIVYQRAILIDPMVVFMCLFSIWALISIFEKMRFIYIRFVLLFLLLLFGMLMKPLYFLPFFLILLLYLVIIKEPIKRVILLTISLISFLILFVWLSFSNSINLSYFFTKDIATLKLLGISSVLDFGFYATMFWRFTNIMLTPYGMAFYLLSFVCLYVGYKEHRFKDKTLNLFYVITAIPILYLLLFANINKPHSYYQVAIMPYLAMSLGFGFNFLVDKINGEEIIKKIIIVAMLFVFLLSSFQVMISNRYFANNKDVMEFARAIRGKVIPGKYALFFAPNISDNVVGTELGLTNTLKYSDPSYLLAMDTFGLIRNFDDYKDALSFFSSVYPHFNNQLDYVVFYKYKLSLADKVRLFSAMASKKFFISYDDADLVVFKK